MAISISVLVAVLLSLALLSYLIADNPIFRIASHLFIGLAAGYAAVAAWLAVIAPPFGAALGAPGGLAAALPGLIVPLVAAALGLLLLLKTAQVGGRATGLAGTLVVALMVGVGAAVAVGGALTGTLLPQTSAAAVSLLPFGAPGGLLEALIENVFIVIGTLATLAFFYYGGWRGRGAAASAARRPALLRPVAGVGQLFMGAAFGLMYAGALAASLTLFVERSAAIWDFVLGLAGR
jgi:hypothetical protein